MRRRLVLLLVMAMLRDAVAPMDLLIENTVYIVLSVRSQSPASTM